MRILYGVQGTGQGHISRARAMARALREWPMEVTWLFSGRPREKLYGMEAFGDFEHRHGLSFTTREGRVCYLQTARDNKLPRFLREARELRLDDYDIVVSDYEPVTSLAARAQGRRVIGIGHQYAFCPETPVAGASWLQRQVMTRFAPVDLPMGLHWHPYADNILPPILDLPDLPVESQAHVVVYLPFEDQAAVTAVLQQFAGQRFVQYSPFLSDADLGNVQLRRADVTGFKRHLASCCGVICNSGFELISECLQWRKPVLTKPLQGQMEQLSNALALRQLGYAATTAVFDRSALGQWLEEPLACPEIRFPDVATALATWLATGCHGSPAHLSERLWRHRVSPGVHVPRVDGGAGGLPAPA